jgi:hypothetical protein
MDHLSRARARRVWRWHTTTKAQDEPARCAQARAARVAAKAGIVWPSVKNISRFSILKRIAIPSQPGHPGLEELYRRNQKDQEPLHQGRFG